MAWYNTGTIALTNGSATVTGSGTNFLVGAQIGEALYAPDGKLYEIQTINSATVITLASNYLGSTASGQNYQIIPTQSLVADLASDVTDLISDFANVRDYAGNGKFNDGAVGTPGITFTQDQDNGLYRIGSNNWALAAGGQKIVDISTSGINVTGAGTFSGAVTVTGNLINFNTGAGNAPYIQHTGNQLDIRGGTGSTRFLNNAGSQSTVTIRDTGNVNGSGLDVTGTVTASSTLTAQKLVSADGILELDDNGTHNGIINSPASLIINIDSDANSAGENFVIAKDTTSTSGGTELFRVHENGNVGIGVVPTDFTSRKSLDIGLAGKIWAHTAATETGIGANFYFDGAYKRIAANAATRYIQDGNGHTFDVTASGTADSAITSWTTAMRIDASGALVLNNAGGDAQMYFGGTSGTNRMYLARSGSDSLLWNVSNGVMRFGTNNAEAMRLDASGNLLVGSTTLADVNNIVTSHLLEGASTQAGAGAVGIYNNTGTASSPALNVLNLDASTDSSNRFIQFYADVTSSGATAMGGIVGNGASNVQFAALSDAREKENITSITGSLDKITSLNPVEFDWIASGEHCNAGFVAQEVETIFPEFIVDNISSEGEEERKGLTGGMTGGIVAHLVKAIQEQQATIEALTARIAALES